MEKIRGLIVLDYIIFYESDDIHLVVHTIWPTNLNPDKLPIEIKND
ncbi:hypothetical protein ACJVDH_01560 [Pedobacter sp. AW1-32]